MSSVTGTASNKPSKQGAAGSRLASLYESYNPKTLLRKDIYVSGFKDGVVACLAVVSILALYSIIAIVTVLNAVKSLRSRRASKDVILTPPGEFELEIKNTGKPVEEVGLNMDDVQEIPGEVEFAAMKEVMPAPDQIPEINDEPQNDGSSDEHEATHHFLSDDDSTLIGQDELVGVKGSPVVVPSVPTIKEDFERPISPPATPPIHAASIESPTVDVVEALQANPRPEDPVVEVVPDQTPNRDEPSKTDEVHDKAAEVTANSVEAAVKAVEEHAKIVEAAGSPTDSVEPSTDSPVSEFVVVPSDVEEESKKPVEAAPVLPVEAVPTIEVVPPVEVAPVPAVESPASEPKNEPSESEPAPAPAPVPEVVAAVVEPAKPAPEPQVPVVALVAEPESLEVAPALVEEPKSVEEPKVVEEPKPVEAVKPAEPKPVGPKETSPAPAPRPTPSREGSINSVSPPKSLGRPRVMRRATGATSATAGVTTTTSAVAPAVTVVDDKATARDRALRRADDALNMLAGSILRSSTIDRLPPRPASPTPSGIPRPVSPTNVPRSASPVTVPRSVSPVNLRRSESPSSDHASSRSSSPAMSMVRRGSVALGNGARPTVSRQSTLNTVTNAPEQPVSRSPPAKKTTFANPPRGGSTSPPPMPLPPQRQGSQGTSPQRQGSVRGSPQVPQAAVMSPSVLSRRATIDSNGSPGSPPPTARRPPSPTPAPAPAPTRPPAEEFTTSASARRNVPFPSAPNDGNQPVASASAVRPRPRPRTSTTGSAAPTAPNTLQSSLLATLGAKVTFPSTGTNSTTSSGPNSNVASPVRSDSFASAVSNRDSIISFSDMSDMDVSTSDLDFTGREGHRMGLGARFDSMGSMSSDGGMSGNEEEKRAKRAKRRAKARAQAMKKQKRAKRN